MTEVLAFLAAPFAACVLLASILGYFGIHVILRRVIFVDLALAQIAALGALVGFLRGHEPGSVASLVYSFCAALFGAAIFSWTRRRRERVPQEAIIGITFVVASALSIDTHFTTSISSSRSANRPPPQRIRKKCTCFATRRRLLRPPYAAYV